MTVAELVAKLGLDINRSDWDRAQASMDKLKKGAEGLAAAFGVHEIRRAIDDMITGSVESAHEVKELSEEMGLTTDKVQELGYATKEIGEAGLSTALRSLARNAQSASEKGGESAKMFQRLGIRIHDANGQLLPADRLLENAADGMQRLKNPTERMAMATTLFGRSGIKMIKVMKDGSAGMKELYDKAHRIGAVRSKEMIELAVKEHDAQVDVNYATKALKDSIVDKLLPGKIWLLEKTQALIGWFMELSKNTRIVEAAAVMLSAAMAFLAYTSFSALLSTVGLSVIEFAALGALLILIALLIDDIWVSIEGGDSLGKRFVQWISEAYDGFMSWTSINPVINALLLPLKEIVFWLGEMLDGANAFIMAAQSGFTDFSGFKLMKEDIKKHYANIAKQVASGAFGGADLSGVANVLTLGLVGGGANTVAPAASAAAAGGASASTGPMTVHQTITATPGMDPKAVGDAAASSFQEVHDNMAERLHNKLIPRLATVTGG